MPELSNEKKLQSAIKRTTALRDVAYGTTGYKPTACNVEYCGGGWYKFTIDDVTFECRWETLGFSKNSGTKFYFRNNKTLENAYYCDQWGVDEDRVKYCSSLYFGSASECVKPLWVLGEVLCKKKSWQYYK